MRSLGLLMCLAACTLDNPAFAVTDGGTLVTDTAPDPTRPTTGTDGATTPSTDPATSDPSATSEATVASDASTAQVSDTDLTTGPPATSTSTSTTTSTSTDATTDEPPPMTATATTDDSDSDSDTGPGMCVAFADPLGPLVPLQVLPNKVGVATQDCIDWQAELFHGRLTATNTGVTVAKDAGCLPSDLPVEGFFFPIPLSGLPAAKGECVSVRFSVHLDHPKCNIAGLVISRDESPVLWGSFGKAPFAPALPLQVSWEATGGCDCPGCCGDAPGPDLYTFKLPMAEAAQGVSALFFADGKKHVFSNLRSHVHAPECDSDELTRADWLHFDWVAVQVQ